MRKRHQTMRSNQEQIRRVGWHHSLFRVAVRGLGDEWDWLPAPKGRGTRPGRAWAALGPDYLARVIAFGHYSGSHHKRLPPKHKEADFLIVREELNGKLTDPVWYRAVPAIEWLTAR